RMEASAARLSRRSGRALTIDALAVRHVPEAVIVAELGVEPWRDLRKPASRPGRTRCAPVGVPVRAVVALDNPDGDKAAVDRDAEVGEGSASEDPVLAAAPAVLRLQRGKENHRPFNDVVSEPFVLEIP